MKIEKKEVQLFYVVAIDGPAGSGKSSTAALVAQKLAIPHIDTGAMYRTLALLAIEKNIDKNDAASLSAIARDCNFLFERNSDGSQKISVNGRDISTAIRSKEISSVVSLYCQSQIVRNEMVKKQKEAANHSSIVLEGRDIGTVVFPNARFKFFVTASIEERARRRALDFERAGKPLSLEKLKEEIAERDRIDSTRPVSPLVKASDAVLIDTTGLSVTEQVDIIVDMVNKSLTGS